MNALAQILAGVMALTLITMWVLETFFHGSRRLYSIFRIDPHDVPAVKMWAINVGFYNLCYGIGIAIGLWLLHFGDPTVGRGILIFCLVSHVFLGAVLYATNRKLWKSALGQSLLPLAALVAMAVGG